MAEEKGTILTESGLKKLEEQLDYLISVRRNEISEQIAVAHGFGDLSENAVNVGVQAGTPFLVLLN